MRNELRLSVQDAIAKQKPKFQAILLASIFNELSLNQAAGALGITPAAAKSQFARVRQRLSHTMRRRLGLALTRLGRLGAN